MAKARKKYFASRNVLECRGPLKKRLQVFQSIVGGAALWYASAAMPTPQAMGALNTMQLEREASEPPARSCTTQGVRGGARCGSAGTGNIEATW